MKAITLRVLGDCRVVPFGRDWHATEDIRTVTLRPEEIAFVSNNHLRFVGRSNTETETVSLSRIVIKGGQTLIVWDGVTFAELQELVRQAAEIAESQR